jgi:Phytanoyl-CoA dioxygenase (PhyH)
MADVHAASDGAEELGSIGVLHLRRLWSRILARRAGTLHDADDPAEWVEHDTIVRGLHLGLPETLSVLYDRAPTFEEFERWIVERNGGTIEPERVARINAALTGQPLRFDDIAAEPVFGERDLAWWDEQGYVVLHDAVPPENCAAAEDAIWSFLEMDRGDPETWYFGAHGHSIRVPLLHHPAFWANRNAPRVRRAFAQLWNREDLWVTVDQAGFNPPERPGWKFPGPHLHWDTSLATPIPFGLQGILYLTDVAANQGAFTCVPGFHRRIESWLSELPPDADPRRADLSSLGPVPIAGRAGDLVIWRDTLPHGSSPNRASRPRIVQYITMQPSRWEYQNTWK